LHNAGAIPEINKNHPAMIAHPVYPATQDHIMADVIRSQGAAIVSTTHIAKKIQLLHRSLRYR
jgi:hypothetical protein